MQQAQQQVPGAGLLGSEVGRRIRAARLERGMTLAQVGGSDLSRSFLSLVELGRSRISLRALAIVADRLDLPISYFLDDAAAQSHVSAELILDYAETALARHDAGECLRLLETAPTARSLQARSLYLRGTALTIMGRAREAVPALRDALDMAHTKDDPALRCQVRYGLGLALYTSDAYDEALTHLRHVVEEAQGPVDDPMLRGKAMICIGHILYVRNEVDAALQHYERARDLFSSVANLSDLACIYSGLSATYERKGDMSNALRYSRLSLGVFEAQNNGRQAAAELNNMAVRYRELREFEQALRCAEESVSRARQVGATDVEAAARSTVAAVHVEQGNFEAARLEAQTAADLTDGDSELARVDAWIVLAKIAEHDGDTARADTLFEQALDRLHTLGHRAEYADTALAFSLALRLRGETDRALDFALQAAQSRPAQPA